MKQGILPSCLTGVYTLFIAVLAGFTTFAQDTTSYSILVAGHAYGAHAGTNIGLHPPLLSKLMENRDTTVEGLFLTGDIVNTSTAASWAQVEKELAEVGLPAYYIMGNHDNNTIGRSVFIARHGSLYYSFFLHDDLYIILNSTETDRSIAAPQLAFLTEILQKSTDANRRVFIFFHEVLWNSHEKYRLVRSNSRSRYAQIRSVSNFWQKVVPVLDAYPGKNFYLFSGDVGGNPDAIAAFFDRWGHMTLLSSGIGEVPDENYMKVNITPDTVTFSLIALNSNVQMQPVTAYSVPVAPQHITGPEVVNPPETGISYEVSPVFNADAYQWTFSSGITGSSDTTFAMVSFDGLYQTGLISVRAVKDGFGVSDSISLKVNASGYTSVDEKAVNSSLSILQNRQNIYLNYASDKVIKAHIKIFNLIGMLIYDQILTLGNGYHAATIDKQLFGKGIVVLNCTVENQRLNKKILLY